PNRSVTMERMTEPDSPETTNELTLTPVDGGTLLSLVITYPDASVRDLVLETGMAEGMEASYARLETRVLEVYCPPWRNCGDGWMRPSPAAIPPAPGAW